MTAEADLARVVARINTRWTVADIEAAITDSLLTRTFGDVAAAAVDAARRPELRSPQVIRTHQPPPVSGAGSPTRVPEFVTCPRCGNFEFACQCQPVGGVAAYRDELARIAAEKTAREVSDA